MNIVFITINDPVFLPAFFDKFLANANPEDTIRALLVKPYYRNLGAGGMALRVLRTFGLRESLHMALEIAIHTLLDRVIPPKPGGPLHSVRAAFAAHGREAVPVSGNVNDESILQRLTEWETDLIISVGCPQLFKKPLIRLPKKGCLNLHGAPLPRYRGVLPSFWMLKRKITMNCSPWLLSC